MIRARNLRIYYSPMTKRRRLPSSNFPKRILSHLCFPWINRCKKPPKVMMKTFKLIRKLTKSTMKSIKLTQLTKSIKIMRKTSFLYNTMKLPSKSLLVIKKQSKYLTLKLQKAINRKMNKTLNKQKNT